MGVALPGGDMKEVFETVKTDNYMGWKSCTMEEAQAAANNGTAAIGISDSKIVVLAADDAEEPIEPTVEVLAITDTTPAVAVAGLQYYSYGYGSTSTDGSSTSTSTVRRSNFGSIEYNGHTYEIFVPNHLETTINPVWTTVETVIKKGDMKFDKWKFLAGLQFPKYTGGLNVAGGDFNDDISRSVVCRAEIKTKIGFVGIFIGAINAASDAYDQLFVKATFQKTSDNRRRVILETGSIEAERKFNSLASNVPISAYYNNAGSPLNQAGILTAVGNLYEEITGKSKVRLQHMIVRLQLIPNIRMIAEYYPIYGLMHAGKLWKHQLSIKKIRFHLVYSTAYLALVLLKVFIIRIYWVHFKLNLNTRIYSAKSVNNILQ